MEEITKEELEKLIDVNNEEVTGYSFKLDNFEGPLDLLLHLIKQSKMEIETVELSKITEQYIQIISNSKCIDLEKASEFVELAATLVEIKSKSLLPKLIEGDEVEEDDPAELLRQRLQEYQLFKETSEKLKNQEDVNKFYKAPEEEANKFRVVLKDMSMDLLLNAFTNMLTRATKIETNDTPKQIEKEKFTVTQKIASIKDALIVKPAVKFSELFNESISRDEVITTFLALLELLKLQEIKCKQTEHFYDIEIVRAQDEVSNG